MQETVDPLVQIFETIHQKYGLPINQKGKKKTAQGPLYFLELEQDKKYTRLLYADRAATADFYDCKDQRYLNYTILSVYQRGQDLFLQTQDSDISKKLLEQLTPENIQTHRRVIKISLDDFSEVEGFLDGHLENY